jgi:hypothetical protein
MGAVMKSASIGAFREVWLLKHKWTGCALVIGYQIERRNIYGAFYVGRRRLWLKPIQYEGAK